MCQKFDLEALTPYVDLHTRMNWKCLKCGDLIENISINSMNGRQGGKCQVCKGRKKRT
jgi:DNA-directed RNA polymerase subunit RPC12/RpoP